MSDLELTMMRRVGELNKEVASLKAENARLKTEVEHLMVFCNCTLIPNKELQAEVERLTALVESNLNQSKLAMAKSDAFVRTLEAQVDRLTKAGDYMSSILQDNYNDVPDDPLIIRDGIRRWFAAKEGKQP
jgi:uncharacterized small protein (DUF1192 family)